MNDDRHLIEEQLASEVVFKGKLLEVRRDTVRLPNDGESLREYIVHPGAVVVLAHLPPISVIAHFLVSLGAQIEGIGSNVMQVHGVSRLGGCEHSVTPDHIEIGSFIGLAAVTNGVYYRRILEAGMHGDLRRAATTINDAATAMGRKVTALGGATNRFESATADVARKVETASETLRQTALTLNQVAGATNERTVAVARGYSRTASMLSARPSSRCEECRGKAYTRSGAPRTATTRLGRIRMKALIHPVSLAVSRFQALPIPIRCRFVQAAGQRSLQRIGARNGDNGLPWRSSKGSGSWATYRRSCGPQAWPTRDCWKSRSCRTSPSSTGTGC